MKPAYHAIFVALTTGTLVLSFLAVSYRFWFRPNRPLAQSLWSAGDVVALYAALFGTLALIAAIVTGMVTRPLEALINSPITKNKILASALTLVCWAGLLAIRVKAGPRLWELRGIIPHLAYVLALAGVVFLIVVNSIGGDLSGIPSGYEQIAQTLGFRTRHAIYFPTTVNLLLWIVGLAVLLGAILRRFRAKPSHHVARSTSGPHKCGHGTSGTGGSEVSEH